MGQAKARGTRAQRVAQAIARDNRTLALSAKKVEEAEQEKPSGKAARRMTTLLAIAATIGWQHQ